MSRKIIAGNWKMNMLPNEAMSFINELAGNVKDVKSEIILCVPYTDLFYSLLTAQKTNIKIGAQNMHWEEKGAYTGEISADMLKCINVEYVILGHSERRKYFNETDEIVNKKIKAAVIKKIKPIVCIGETLEEKEKGITKEVVISQIKKDFENITKEEMENVVIAYEPIWAIGTGKVATPVDANNIIKDIRNEIQNLYGKEVSENISILYGGSVKEENASNFFNMSDIDGALIGGASLNVEEFYNIIKSMN